MEEMDFSWALRKLKSGYKLTRTSWNGPNQYIELQIPDENSKMGEPYIYIKPVSGKLVPWLASQTDMLSSDWTIV